MRQDQAGGEAAARDALSRGEAVVAVVTPSRAGAAAHVFIDGTELFAAQAALRSLAELRASSRVIGPQPQSSAASSAAISPTVVAPQVQVLFNPDLRTAVIMIPGLCGVILVFVGTIATALGVVRERQAGTMEQLAVMPSGRATSSSARSRRTSSWRRSTWSSSSPPGCSSSTCRFAARC